MSFFDKLHTNDDVVTSLDSVRACMDETFDGITVQDKVREMFLNVDSENATLFKDSEKKELLYHLLRLVCVGGAMCQSEERAHEWKEMAKAMYKDCVQVQKCSDSQAGGGGPTVEITSTATHVDPGGYSCLFPRRSPHNLLYVVTDCYSGYVTVVYKPFVPFW